MRFLSALTVTELNQYVKDLLDLNPPLTDIYVKGEISNYKAHSSGHLYFTLKDEGSALKCVMFRGSAYSMTFRPENGMKVTAHGRISSFVRDGAYQLYCDSMEPDGVGSLYIAFEQLKKKLEAEGLFAESRKKPLPKIPARVGVVTSPTGAAVRDIINVCKRRFPYAEIIVYPALVQGEGAVASVTAGIEFFNKRALCDVLIVGRGGGSIEDLWAFNCEPVARAVAASRIPVISAVGHETDFTICDFVADRRAPTPSAAAEIAVPDILELKHKFNNIISRESAILTKRFEYLRDHLRRLERSRPLLSPMNTIEDKRMTVASVQDRLELCVGHIIEKKRAQLSGTAQALNALNPLAVLSRGYSAVFDNEGRVVKSVKDTEIGKTIALKLSDGSISAIVKEVNDG
ncbi:MAG: exodeoxyribonuclease VII large subunit [Ruminococcaceae bacterium]|nr:exodeoxyribonuclease VII large subunit [Oscillospiraceae bacterium]